MARMRLGRSTVERRPVVVPRVDPTEAFLVRPRRVGHPERMGHHVLCGLVHVVVRGLHVLHRRGGHAPPSPSCGQQAWRRGAEPAEPRAGATERQPKRVHETRGNN